MFPQKHKNLIFSALLLACLVPLPAIGQKVEPRQYRADLFLNLAARQITNGQFVTALQSLRESLILYQEIGNRQGEANVLQKLGEINFTRGRYYQSIRAYEQSLAIVQTLQNKPMVVQVLEQLSNTYVNIGNEKKAKELRERAEAIEKEIGNPKKETAFLGNVGLQHEAQGEYALALAFHSQQLTNAQKLGNIDLQINSLKNIGRIYRQLGQYPQARIIYQQQLEFARRLKNKALELDALNNFATTFAIQGNYPGAIAFYQQQLELVEKLGDVSQRENLLKLLGRTYSAAGQHEQAITLYQQQLAAAKTTKNLLAQGTALNNLAFALIKNGKLTEAQKYLQDSIKTWQSLRAKLDIQDDYSAEQSNTYRLLQEILVAQKQPESALVMAEEERIMTFLKLLGMRLSSDSAAINLKAAPEELAPPTIKDIQSIAQKENATLVKYALTSDDKIYVWVITPEGKITFKKIDPKSQNTIYPVNSIAEVVASIPASLDIKLNIQKLELKDKQKSQPLLQLHQLLIKPIADLLPKNPNERVIFIGQDEFLLIPFPALIDISGKYLIEKHTISITPAIQVLKLTQKQRVKTGGSKNLVVGNPTMPSIAKAIGGTSQPLPSLLNAEQEALVVANLLNTQALVGNQATKAAILRLLPKAKRIHLATYGIFDDVKRQGIPGALALAPGGNDNGLLTASEILNLYTQPKRERLQAQLAVISAGKMGDNNNTEAGIVGLSLALINAGVPSLVISQWANPDTPNSAFMSEFYRQLQSQPNKAIALRNAMLAIQKEYPNPRNWAGFSLIGAAN
jgi:CHAT domain-containing protein